MNKVTLDFLQLPLKVWRSSLFRAAGTYGVFSLLNSAIPFLMMPVFTRLLSPTDYGVATMFSIIQSVVFPFIALCGVLGVSRIYYSIHNFDNATYSGTVFLFGGFTWIIITLIFYFFKTPVSTLLNIPEGWLLVIPTAAYFHFIISLASVSWQIREKPRQYGYYQMSSILVEITVSLFFVAYMGFGWEGRLISRFFTALLFAIIGLYYLQNSSWILLRFDWNCLKHSLKMGVPMVPHNLLGVLNASVDKMFISRMIGLADVGLYGVGYQVGGVLRLLAAAFNEAYTPWIFRKLRTVDAVMKRKIVLLTYAYFIVIVLLAVLLSAFAPLLMKFWLGEKFHGSIIFVIWIALGEAFNGMRYMVVKFLYLAEKTYFISLATLAGAILNIPLNYVFIKRFGAIGAAQTSTLIQLTIFLLTWFFAAKSYDMPWRVASKLKECIEHDRT